MSARCFSLLTLLLVLLGLQFQSADASPTDQNKWPAGQVPPGQTNGSDGLDDIWQEKFNAWGIAPGADSDNDGLINSLEAVAGTHPFAATDRFKIGNMTIVGNAVEFRSKVEAGKKYRVLSADMPNGPVWVAETLQSPVSGTTEYNPSADLAEASIYIQTPGNTKKFYKLETSDVSSSPDGVSDWAKRKLGLVPGQVDSNGDGVSDMAEINQALQTQDVITVEAETAFTSEDGGPAGLLRLRRNNSLLGARIYYTLGGTATAGTDFAALAGFVDFAPGAKTATIAISPTIDAALEGGEAVTVTLSGGMAGNSTPVVIDQAKKQAAVIISNTTEPTGTGLLARYYDHANGTYAHAANFGDAANYAFTRSASPLTAGTIVVTPTSGNTTALLQALSVGDQVKLSFNGGNLNNALYSHFNYPVTAKTSTTFTCSINAVANLPTSSSSTCNFSIQSFTHPAVIQRVDATVDYEWMGGTPHGVGVAAAAGTTATNVPDNYSDTFEMYLSPATAGSYRFQLDADDKARVLLDLNDGNGLQQILEHGWDGATTPETIGTFKISASYSLAVPAAPANRYKMRVEHVETTGEARCRLQWSRDGGTFANIPQAEQFTHTQAMTYAFTRSTSPVTTGTATITLAAHGLSVGNQVALAFTNGTLFTPNTIDPNGYSGTYSIATVPDANTFTVTLNSTGSTLPANQSAGATGFLENRSTSSTTGVYNKTYTTTDFTKTPGRIGVDNAVTTSNNGLWGTGTPDWNLINADSFTVRWSGQVQPQFTEEYTFVVWADDGASLKINGVVQDLKMLPAANTSGSTYTYDSTTGNAVITYAGSILKPDSIVVGESVRLDPSSGNLALAGGSTYTYDSVSGNAVINYSNLTNVTPGSFAVGESVEVDPTSGSVNLGQLAYDITAATGTTFTVNIGAGLFPSGSGSITVSDNLNRVVTAVTATSFTVNFGAGEYVTGAGNMSFDFVNKSLKDWSSNGNERFVRLPMNGGVRYDIELDYWESGGFSRCRLYWFSPSQPKQIIPSERLYPASVSAPAEPLVETEAVALVGGAFSYLVQGSNGSSVSVSGLPAWLSYNGGVISGTPPAGAAGLYQIMLTFTNAAGTSQSLINLRVEDSGGGIVHESWSGVSGSSVATLPISTPPAAFTNLSSLAAPTDFGDGYGARIRGYITAPVTGNYYFWIAASNAAELWISNDAEPVNSIKRAQVSGGTASQEWNKAGETRQKSPWLALDAGKRYYFEILHNAGTGAGDNLAVGWLKPGQTGAVPSEIVPGHVLTPYVTPPPGSTPGTLYVASMLSQNGADTNGVGTSTLRLSEDENTAIVNFSYSGLTGEMNDWHVHVDPYLSHASAIVYDGVEPVNPNDGPQPDGSHHWTIEPVGTLSKADIIEIIKQGKAYINLHTAMYPAGEIRGNYTLAIGSRAFTPPPAPPEWTDDHTTDAGAVRFLTQATYGANIADITALKNMASYEAWIDDQFTKPASLQLPEVLARELSDAGGGAQFDETLTFNAWWRNSIVGADQLRQRIAFALSEILVVSAQGPLDNRAEAISYFYDRLASDAFGNFRDILEDVTLSPAMGRYLDMLRNDKPDITVGRIPNENYAREIKQLFSIGLFRMWPDGTLVLNSKDAPIDTYTQREIVGFSHVFTGWDYGYDGAYRTALNAPTNWIRQMREVPARHFTGPKRLLNNEVLPGLATAGGQALDPYAVHNSTHFNDPAYQNLPAQELDVAHDQLFNHSNVGPFICRQLIQRLVTSNPSRDYLYRVVQRFNDNGFGVRGDMKAVIKAILLDYDARSASEATKPAFGKQREPVMRVANAARAFRLNAASGTYSQTGSHTIAVTMANKLAGGNTVYLAFPRVGSFTPGDTTPTSEAYTVLSTPAPTTSLFYVNAKGWTGVSTSNGTSNGGVVGTYSQTAGSSTMTINITSHWLAAGHKAWLDFGNVTTGTAMTDGAFVVTSPATDSGTSNSFTITAPDTTARTGFVRMTRFQGSFTVENSGLPSPQDKRITFDTTSGGIADHHLIAGNPIYLNFTVGNPRPTDGEFVVESVPDSNTFTVLTSAAIATQGGSNDADNGMWMFPLVSQPLTRSGNVNSLPSTFNMGNTTTDLEQTPLNSPTVFNFFVPDYKYPGALASQGISTPEFQITAETTAVRQANFFYNGLFNPGNTNGISSFKSGTNALVLDFSPWMANATDLGLGAGSATAEAWTSNTNLPVLIDRLNTLLMAGQLSSSAKTIIQNFLTYERSIASIARGNPCTVTTTAAHGLVSNESITIAGVSGGTFSPTINGTYTVTVTGANTFTVPVNFSAGTATATNARVSYVPYTNAAPTDTQKRDRLRSIIHFILSSPDYTIQR